MRVEPQDAGRVPRAGRGPQPGVGVAIATRDRRDSLLRTLEQLAALPEQPPVVVVDNGSSDGSQDAVRALHPEVELIELGQNRGTAARTLAVRSLSTPLVAFSDDDSWWEPRALERAARAFACHPRLGLLAARVLVGDEGRLDPTCAAMARSPMPRSAGLPGPPVLGFVACGAVVRRAAYLSVGGFHPRLGVGGEETLLAIDLAAAGWQLAYVEEVVARHHPWAVAGERPGRRHTQLRNDLWTTWLRRPAAAAARHTAALALRRGSPRALAQALGGLPWVLRERRVVPPGVERALVALGY